MKGLRLIKKIAQNKQGRIGLIILLVLVVIAVFAPVIAPFDPYDVTMRDAKGLAPGRSHLLGTTITTGQDVFSMLIYGTRVSLGIGIITGVIYDLLGLLFRTADLAFRDLFAVKSAKDTTNHKRCDDTTECYW